MTAATSATQADTVRFVDATGDPFTLGHRHGVALGARLRAFLGDATTRLNHLLPEPVSMAGLRPVLAAYHAAIAAAAPALATELAGLAEGARLADDEATLLQARREILGYRRIPTAGDCTTYARATTEPVLAQTVDLNGNLDDQIAVLRLGHRTRRVLVLSFGGQLGYLGLNSDGLAIGLNLVLGGTWRPGLPPYLAIRHLLDNAGSVADAVSLLRTLPLASSRSLTLCDATGTATVEILGDEQVVTWGKQSLHTNHYLDPRLSERDELNVFARNSSVRRLAAAADRLAGLPADATVSQHLDVLCRPPIRVPDTGDIHRERTVAAVVLRPERGELHVRPGDPAGSATRTFTLA